ncbi:phosphatidate cytidylyltransferase [Mycoplasmopsis lipofaciens]|uniref:phosphatidate cytidylyltransferase n=1 Tax=Mycoplasmopsis lipofaciens TaxID=114884 RepID=UPI0004884BDC|nr:phosphatidate cytidylyltransferase [Mycoplasmopsis lipofaciens]
MKLFKERILPGIIFTLIILGIIIPLSIFGPSQPIARICSFIFSGIFISLISYEYLKGQRIPLPYVFLLMLPMIFSVMLPIVNLKLLTDLNNSKFDSSPQFIGQMVREIAKDWVSILFIFSVSLFIFIIEFIYRTNMMISDRVIRMILTFISLYILSISTRIAHMFLILNWKYLLVFFLIPVAHDIGAFMGGKTLGHKFFKQKLAPKISPNKTWEGFIFGIIASMIIATILSFSLNLFSDTNNFYSNIEKSFLIIFGPLISALGDLYFSYIKRINGIKDYSRLLLGHGGILDRFDSLSFIGFLFFIIFIFI